ncbi:hypothetical protein ASPFODRAFT_48572 [Aspergillus luchuensis CBS 106.47]|uniref:Uncharacterized protein n=1 Tax=Aspergillus luchuensis (strain CBS 106.47) TaxID=1137211 RepID=A0A1M3TCP3_ASPLC|nr:hypothetical protein ASPFODRAFT_48572 [Aspergillus luchuensis CBS 106.47]
MGESTAKSASEQYDTVSESRVRLRDTSQSASPDLLGPTHPLSRLIIFPRRVSPATVTKRNPPRRIVQLSINSWLSPGHIRQQKRGEASFSR